MSEQANLKQRLEDAEATLDALRRGEVDAVVGREHVMLLRLREAEAALRAAAAGDRFRFALSDALRPLADPLAIQREAAVRLREHLGVSNVRYVELGNDKDEQSITSRPLVDDYGLLVATLLSRRETLVVPDVSLEARLDLPKRERLQSHAGVLALVIAPVRKQGELVALLVVHDAQPHAWTSQEIGLIEDTAERTASAVGQARAEAELREGRERFVQETSGLVQALREASQRKDEFIALLAHELRNPLAPLRTGLQLLRKAPLDSRMGVEALAIMERQLAQLMRLVDDLLDTSRIASGKLELRTQPMDLADAVRVAVETSMPLLVSGKHELRVQLPDGPLPVHGDPVRLAQVFGNLLNNAARYTPPGGHVVIRAHADGSDVFVTVEDDGVGIPEDMLDRVFEPFMQVECRVTESQGGLGLGLSLARRLIQLHGGSIHAESRGKSPGTRIRLRLPASLEATHAPPD